MKKVLSLVLAMAMILSSFSFALALPSDVEGTDYADAVARLGALDIIVGYEDGTFKPDNSITRAEFAAIVVRALGMEDIARGSAANTKFADVLASHWASGYINLASAQGIIVGYPDGTFKPEAQVTYSEAVAMLVRLLGYEPALTSDQWPSNYLTKASEIGLTLGVKFNYNDHAKRGVVSTLVNKALDIDLMDLSEVTSGDRTWKITDDTLLTKYLNVIELEDAQVIETVSHSLTKLDADEVKIKTDTGKTFTFKIIESVNADELLGHEVTVFVKDTDTDGKHEDDELVISIQDTTDARDVIAYDYIVDITKSDEDDYDITEGGMEIGLDDADDEFELAKDAIVFYNYERVTDLTDMADPAVGVGYVELGEVAGKVILNDDDEIIFMDMVNYDKPVVITEVNVKDEKVKYFLYNESESTLKLDGEDYVVMKNGEVAEFEDLAADDVLYFWDLGTAYVLDAYDYKIEGILDSVDSDNNNYWDYTLVVDGKNISVGPAFTMSTDENDTVDSLATNPSTYVWTADDDRLSDLEDMVGEQVTVYIGKYFEETEGWNYGRHIATGIDTDEDNFFVVTEKPWSSRTAGYKYYVELMNQYGDEITYEFTEDETEFNGTEKDLSVIATMTTITEMLPQGTLVDVEFNSDGTISAVDVIKAKDAATTFSYTGIDDDYDRIKIDGKSYYVSGTTVFFGVAVDNITDLNYKDADAYTWDDIADINSGSFKVVASSDDSELEVIVFYYEDSADFALGKNDYGYVLKREIRTDGLWLYMAVEDQVVEYYAGDLSKATQNSLQEKVLVNFTASGSDLDKVTLISKTELTATAAEMTENMMAVTIGETTSGSGIYAFSKFEIVSGGVDTKNGIIEVMAVGTDEDVDKTWFIDVDKYGVDSFYYDVDISHRVLENKILSLEDLTDGDMIYIYDVSETSVTEYIAVYDR